MLFEVFHLEKDGGLCRNVFFLSKCRIKHVKGMVCAVIINIFFIRGISMEKVIATIVIIVLTMGLISYAIIGQMGGFRDTADVVTEEESRLDTMLKDSTVVPLSTVKNYINKSTSGGYLVYVDETQVTEAADLTDYNANTLFTMSKTYDEYGKISIVSFLLKDQSFAKLRRKNLF